MELVTPDIRYKDTFIAALKDGFCFGSQPPLGAEEIANIENDFEIQYPVSPKQFNVVDYGSW